MQETSTMTRKERTAMQRKTRRKSVWSWIREFVIAIIVVLLVRSFLFSIYTVVGTSMLETLQNGDRLYVSILTPNLMGYERGDVVICRYPGRSDQCVKRIIGLPGETVEIAAGVVYVNGIALKEDYLTHQAVYSYPAITLGEGEYFVLGDNRPVSHDSHSEDVGPVTHMMGKVRYVIWPLNRFGPVD